MNQFSSSEMLKGRHFILFLPGFSTSKKKKKKIHSWQTAAVEDLVTMYGHLVNDFDYTGSWCCENQVKKNIRNESSSQILRAETIFNPRELGIRRTENWRKARFPTSPRIRFLIGHCTIVTWSLLEPKINTSNKRTKEKQKEFLLTENSSQITSTL